MSSFTNAELYACCDNHAEPNWAEYDALELHGGAMIHHDGGEFDIETGVSAAQIDVYSIMAHFRTGGGTDDITDVRNYADAIAVLNILAQSSGLPANIYVDAPQLVPAATQDTTYPAARYIRTIDVMGRTQPGFAPEALEDPLAAYAAFLHDTLEDAERSLSEDSEDAFDEDGIEACVVGEDGTITSDFWSMTRHDVFNFFGVEDIVAKEPAP